MQLFVFVILICNNVRTSFLTNSVLSLVYYYNLDNKQPTSDYRGRDFLGLPKSVCCGECSGVIAGGGVGTPSPFELYESMIFSIPYYK